MVEAADGHAVQHGALALGVAVPAGHEEGDGGGGGAGDNDGAEQHGVRQAKSERMSEMATLRKMMVTMWP